MTAFSVVVNGRAINVSRGATIADLVAQLNLTAALVVVEFNGQPLVREEFGATELAPGDSIEIAQMVGGG